MKKIIILIVLFMSLLHPLLSQEDENSISLPKINIEIQDLKDIELDIMKDDPLLPEINIDIIPKPDFTENIKIDLEKTLPEKIDSPERLKPVDALIIFGYGLNNFLYADFSLFVNQYNPKISVHYHRESKKNLWFNRTDDKSKNPDSLDDLNAQVIYNYKNFGIGAELGYFAHTYKLQDKSVFYDQTRRAINADLSPSIKFNFNNDLTLRVLNTFLINDCNGEINDEILRRMDFDYFLNTDLAYTQVFNNIHFLKAHAGYNFNYLDSFIDGNENELKTDYTRFFFNTIKAGAGYSTTLKDSFLLKVQIDFQGLFKDTDFFWYLLPFGKLGYSFHDFFHCYIEGGGRMTERPDIYWFKDNSFVYYPADITPGYHWFAKTGVKGSFTGWVSGNVDLEFAYNYDAHDWNLEDKDEKLFTLENYSFFELNLSAGIEFNAKDIFNAKIDYMHCFLDRMHFLPTDIVIVKLTWNIKQIGLKFYTEFTGEFIRLDIENNDLGNIYLMNAGIDWAWQDRLGFGAMFMNILYFQTHKLKPYYDEPGFEFIGYLRIGF